MIIGSHVSFGKEQLLGSVKEAVKYNANTFMFYTGAPQNTVRTPINDFNTMEAYKIMKEHDMALENVICHAPYIVNLANNKDADKYKFGIEFLIEEVNRCSLLGVTKLVLHPGSAVGIEKNTALRNIIYALNVLLDTTDSVTICLETMAGKGTEFGINTDELATIIDNINKKELIGVCIDTCHLNDSGIDLNKFDEYLDEFDQKIGIDKIKVMHVNDSKNVVGAHKDRHDNIGYGTIGFNTLMNAVYNERLGNIPRILETPYIGDTDDSKDRLYPPYKQEIDMIRKKEFNPNLKQEIRTEYAN